MLTNRTDKQNEVAEPTEPKVVKPVAPKGVIKDAPTDKKAARAKL